ncbi:MULTISPECIES: serine hydrolase [Emticicia]|uniref:serine hydrolase domain-containing protein n=1 Tax=Emticicia TaxID=312278 RepID=UPI0007D8A310|nr:MULTISPECIES: serine hydrolase domain-containing protein [Emticicia]
MKKLIFFLLLSQNLFAQSNEDKIKAIVPELDAKFEAFRTQNHLSSVSYAVLVDGKIVHQSNRGTVNYKTNKIADNQSVYRIASMSKSFASVAILQLRDAGKLKLDDPVWKYIPELRGQKYSADSPDITVRHLLTHAAGFPEDNPWGDRQLGITEAEMLKMFKKGISFSNEPGIAYEYSNMGFAMLGQIIKNVSGQSYQSYIINKIWKPLGMNNTYWDYTKVPDNQLVRGYRWLREQYIEQPFEGDGAYGIMGGILTSIEDFSKYMVFHQKAYQVNAPNSPILKKSSLKEMHFPANFGSMNNRGFTGSGEPCNNVSFYGYGLRIDQNCNQIRSIGHSGGLPGFGSDWKIVPQYGIGIVTFTNGTYGSAALMNNQIVPYIIEKAGISPIPFPVSPILKQRQNELVKLLPSWEGAEKTGIFAENFFMDYFPDLLKAEAEGIFDKVGKIVKINEIVPENALRGKFLIECEKGKVEVSFTMSPENPPLIQAYSIKLK